MPDFIIISHRPKMQITKRLRLDVGNNNDDNINNFFHSQGSIACLSNVLELRDMSLQAKYSRNNLKWPYLGFKSLYSTREYSASHAKTRDSVWSRISSSFLTVSLSVVSSSVTKYAKHVTATEI